MNEERKTLGEMTDAEIGALVRAKNEGKVIEWFFECAWVEAYKPVFDAINTAYRVRPEPKRETVTLFGKVTDKYWGRDFPVSNDTYRIVFDLIDGRPDCDSIKMKPI